MNKWMIMGLVVGLLLLLVVCSQVEGLVDRGTSHTVDIPLTTRTPPLCSSGNFCGPSAKCAMTGAQCTSDIDCVGCMPSDITSTPVLHPYEDSGKASWGLTYSSLTEPWTRDSLNVGPLPALLPPMPYLESDAFKGKFQGGLASKT